jgi:eukaryotic-like serine/threonine-protein kinase
MAALTELQRLNALLAQALELPDGEREAWLSVLPPEAQPLAPQLRALLARAAVETDTFMRRPAALALHAAAALEGRADEPGDLVGPWRLQQPLGAGGMAAVWLAERADATPARQVALKLPHAGASAGLVQRMARERDLLAALEHPNIARLYDAGVTPEGRPWLAMERVAGEPIDEHCRDHALSVPEILALALQVCEALAHAHARLIVHRDLKPANILVTPAGDVRLLDFGVGKLLHDEAGPPRATGVAAAHLTQAIGTALTPDYASPEQVAGEPVTVATDIYSLGIVLYELLAGARPYRLPRQSMAALEEAILAADVPRASQRALDGARASAQALDGAGDSAQVRGKARARQLRGDLDAVLAKALAKRPAQRYSSIEALTADLRAYLEGRPVQAQAPSRRYRITKFLRRNAWPLAMGSAVALSLVLGLSAALWQTRAARLEAARADQARRFITGLLREAQPRQGTGQLAGAVRTADLLVRAGQRIETELARDPALAAEIGIMIGEQLSALGEPQRGEPTLRAAVERARRMLGPRHPITVQGRVLLGESLSVQYPEEARRIADEVVPDALAGLPQTAADAVFALRSQSFQLAKLDQAEPSIRALQQAVAVSEQYLGGEHEQTLISLGLLSNTHGRFRQFERQLAVASEAMRRAEATLGAARPHNTLTAVERWYGEALRRNDRPAEAIPFLRRVVLDQRALDDAETPRVRNAIYQLGLALGEAGQLGEGIALLRQVLVLEAKQNTVFNEDRVAYRRPLVVLLGFARRGAEVETLADETDAMIAANRPAPTLAPPSAPPSARPSVPPAPAAEAPSAGVLLARARAARVMAYRGFFGDAQATATPLVDAASRLQPPDPTIQAEVWHALALMARLAGRPAPARETAERAWNEPARSQARPVTQAALAAELAAAALELGDAPRAAAINREALALYVRAQVSASPLSATAWITEARLHLQAGRAAQALAALDPIVASWAEVNPRSEWHAEALHWRAVALARLGREAAARADRAAAAPLLRASKVPALRRLAG